MLKIYNFCPWGSNWKPNKNTKQSRETLVPNWSITPGLKYILKIVCDFVVMSPMLQVTTVSNIIPSNLSFTAIVCNRKAHFLPSSTYQHFGQSVILEHEWQKELQVGRFSTGWIWVQFFQLLKGHYFNHCEKCCNDDDNDEVKVSDKKLICVTCSRSSETGAGGRKG